MSSDEEDTGAPFPRYRVLTKPWRSEVVTTFLRTLDALHRRYRKMGGSGSKRGSPPRLRYLVADESTSKEVARLPINAYAEEWYKKQTGLRRDDIAARPTPYNFDVDPAVTEYVPFILSQVRRELTFLVQGRHRFWPSQDGRLDLCLSRHNDVDV